MDQRAGKSTFDDNGQPLSHTVTFERMMQDGEEMVAYLRQTYNRKRVFVAGHSWGSSGWSWRGRIPAGRAHIGIGR
jgi:dienelactone hydrolase